MAIYSEFSHKKWWFSIVMLVYQRVIQIEPFCLSFLVFGILQDSFLKSLKGFFEALDTDGSGSIHLEEIKIMLQDSTLW